MKSPKYHSEPIRLFYSYSHKDEDLRSELEKHLTHLKDSGIIQSWHDRKISPGQKWQIEIVKNLEEADIILLLISKNFFNSKYCYGVEMPRALERDKIGEARVIPIIVRPANWEATSIKDLQVLPKKGKPITSLENRYKAWTNVAKGIDRVINELIADRKRDLELLKQIKPDEFKKQILSVSDMKESAKLLYRMVTRSHFEPDIIIGINGGGMIVATAMNASLRNPVGVLDTRNRNVTHISLPYKIDTNKSQHKTKVKPYSKNILVTDTKLKTGRALEIAQTILKKEYGEGTVIRYAIVLGYGNWGASRWKVNNDTGLLGPVQFKPKNLPVYVARYTKTPPDKDSIVEELRYGWEKYVWK
jgi:hypoxanthine phosphoribosyltransferase